MDAFSLTLPDCYQQRAVEEILAKSKIDRSLWPQIGRVACSGRIDGLREILGDEDFDWPWFDSWAAMFEGERRWPDEWDSIRDRAPSYRRVVDVLGELTVAQLRALAAELRVDVGGARKVGDLRDLLCRVVTMKQIKHVADELRRKAEAKVTVRKIKAKRQMLEAAIVRRAYSLNRHKQLVDLFSGPISTPRKVYLHTHDTIARKIAKGWKFDAGYDRNLPPFYPGDRTNIRTERTR